MKYRKEVTLLIGDKIVVATVEVDLPQAAIDAHIDSRMILETVASGQNRSYVSRHHADRNVQCLVSAPEVQVPRGRPVQLRRVA